MYNLSTDGKKNSELFKVNLFEIICNLYNETLRSLINYQAFEASIYDIKVDTAELLITLFKGTKQTPVH